MMFDKHKRVCRQYRTDPFSPGSPSSPCQGHNRNKYLVTVGCKKKKKLLQSSFYWLTVSPRSPAVPSAPEDPYQNDT